MFVYIMASRRNGTLYLGVTNDLVRRVYEHRTTATPGFTSRYGIKTLVWFEAAACPGATIQCEKSLKKWRRSWKLALIEKTNPSWRDLWPEIIA
ncbi:MAG: GIY-YIG nuclease family protein [Pseudomonadota bacterium]